MAAGGRTRLIGREPCLPSASTSQATASATPPARSRSSTRSARCGPTSAIVVRTSAAQWLLDRTVRVPIELLAGRVRYRRRADRQPAARRARDDRDGPRSSTTRSTREREREAELLRERTTCASSVADAPPLGCAAAALAGVPSVVVSNFTWDWIYEAYADVARSSTRPAAGVVREAYRHAEAAWRLPMHGGFATLRHRRRRPVRRAARATRSRRTSVRRLGCPLDRPLVLSSFGGYGVDGLDVARLDCLDRLRRGADASRGGDASRAARDGRASRRSSRSSTGRAALRRPGRRVRRRRDQARLRHHRGMHRESHGDPLHLARRLPRVRRAGARDAARTCAADTSITAICSPAAGRSALDRLLASSPPPESPRTDGADVTAAMIVAQLD